MRRILCATDLSSCSRAAIEHAATLAAWNASGLTLLYVHPWVMPLTGDVPYIIAGAPLREDVRAEVLAALEDVAAPARAMGVNVDVSVREGDPAETILSRAMEQEAGLVVVGTHGRRGFDRWMLGSVATRVAQRAPCPVLTVPRPPEHRHAVRQIYERILCPVDLQDSDATMDRALDIARKAGASLTLLHVVTDLPKWMAGIAQDTWASDYENGERAAREQLRRALATRATDGCEVSLVVLHGEPHREIVTLASTSGASLVVIGARATPTVERLVGSTASTVMRDAHCPVLMVRRGA